MHRLAGIVAATLVMLGSVGPVAGAQPSRSWIPLDAFTTICFDPELGEWVELDVSITFAKVSDTIFYDRNGNPTKELLIGPALLTITDPSTGTFVTTNSPATITIDYTTGAIYINGPALFANTVLTIGRWDFSTGTFHGTFKDYCPAFGYLSYDPNEG